VNKVFHLLYVSLIKMLHLYLIKNPGFAFSQSKKKASGSSGRLLLDMEGRESAREKFWTALSGVFLLTSLLASSLFLYYVLRIT